MKHLLYIFFVVMFTASSVNDARKANRAFENGDYEQAVELYQQAIEDDPNNAKLHFNLGNALFKLGQSDDADRAFEQYRNLTDSPVEESYADYNKGRMLTDAEEYDEAIEHFREALKKNPSDSDARYNYELALKKQQEQEQQEEEQQDDSDQNDEQDEDQDQQDDQQNEDQEQDQDQNEDQNQNQDQQDQDEENSEQEQQQSPVEMSPEEAENILDALKQLERELLENQKKESTESQSSNDRDW